MLLFYLGCGKREGRLDEELHKMKVMGWIVAAHPDVRHCGIAMSGTVAGATSRRVLVVPLGKTSSPCAPQRTHAAAPGCCRPIWAAA